MAEEINSDRRRFLSVAAMTVTAAPFGVTGSGRAKSGHSAWEALGTNSPGTTGSFEVLKQIDAGVLNVGYAELGRAGGPAVVLLHGWPYDIHS
jgi:hypothetical protein